MNGDGSADLIMADGNSVLVLLNTHLQALIYGSPATGTDLPGFSDHGLVESGPRIG